MLRIENTEVAGWEAAIRGMRNPKNSWKKSDSYTCFYEDEVSPFYGDEATYFKIGDSDFNLATRLCKSGTDHRKFMRMIVVYMDIIAPLYWWKEFDTYKVGTVANSCSTMHKIADREFVMEDFSAEHLMRTKNGWVADKNSNLWCEPITLFETLVKTLNACRDNYLLTHDKKWWWQMIQLLPSSYNQRRTIMLSYEVLANIYHSRKNHKLDEWHTFCEWIEALPYCELITGNENV